MPSRTPFRTATGLLGISTLALLGLTACEENGAAEDPAEDADGTDNGADEADEDNAGVGDTEGDEEIGTEDDGQ